MHFDLQREVSSEFEAVLKDFETNSNVNSAVVISAKPGCEFFEGHFSHDDVII